MDFDAYLDRIGATRETSLRDLHRAHLTTVPFENLDIHHGTRISLDADHLFDKIVRRRRGGFCYELNGLFALLLEDLGHTVHRVAARVYGDDGRPGLSSHLALIVDGEWLVDVGFGDHSTYPLSATSRAGQDDPAGRFLVEETADGDLRVSRDGKPVHLIERRPRELWDFTPNCWYQQTSPDSPFTRNTVCTLLTGEGRITISGKTLIRTAAGSRTETSLDGEEALRDAYREHFGISMGG